MPRRSLLTIGTLAAILLTTGFSCKFNPFRKAPVELQPVVLKYWGTQDTPEQTAILSSAWQAAHPTVAIEYRQFRPEEYEHALLNALAEDRGPDLFSLPNTWLARYRSKLAPAPASVNLPYQEIQGTLKKEKVTVVRTERLVAPAQARSLFTDAVADDVVNGGQLWALPFSLDTLVLYYNRALLNAAGIATPPTTWTELKTQVQKLTKVDRENRLRQSGAALGTTANVPWAVDLLSTLMLQNGATMATDEGQVQFHQRSREQENVSPGAEALSFYTSFANPGSEVYSWDEQQPNARQAFLSGQLAFLFGYASDYQNLKAEGPKLNLGLTAFPQLEGASAPTYFARYQVVGVSARSANQAFAWGFIQQAIQPGVLRPYLTATKRPTALRSLVAEQQADPEFELIASQILTAKSWYRGYDALAMEQAMGDMVNRVIRDGQDPILSLNLAAQQVQATYTVPSL